MARRATLIAQTRKQNENVLLLDAGDSLTGDADPAKSSLGQTSVTAMNMLGYDALALGSQDLALGVAVLQQRMAEAKFDFISANAVISATGQWLGKPYVFREYAGRKIAIVGLSDTHATNEIGIRDPLQTAQAIVPQLRQQADMVILLSHAGLSMDQQIAEAVPGIALIISGGTASAPMPWRSAKTGTLAWHVDVPTPGHAGRRVGLGALKIESSGQTLMSDWQGINIDPTLAEDPDMAAWVLKQYGF